jgi:catechol 2,3-dioxygenase-like lactoylglutathione lyase family enzyme
MGRFDATLISERLVETVNFYEDFFGFVPVIEKEGYVSLRKHDDEDMCITVFDTNHKCVENMPSVQGVILNFSVHDAKAAYDHFYMEGLDFYKEYGTDVNGHQHFVVKDPNGVLINIIETAKTKQLEPA